MGKWLMDGDDFEQFRQNLSRALDADQAKFIDRLKAAGVPISDSALAANVHADTDNVRCHGTLRCEDCGKSLPCTPGRCRPFDVRTTEELDGLPDAATIYDVSCQVYQKLSYPNEYPGQWFRPGVEFAYPASDIQLPARLLDDGL